MRKYVKKYSQNFSHYISIHEFVNVKKMVYNKNETSGPSDMHFNECLNDSM